MLRLFIVLINGMLRFERFVVAFQAVTADDSDAEQYSGQQPG